LISWQSPRLVSTVSFGALRAPSQSGVARGCGAAAKARSGHDPGNPGHHTRALARAGGDQVKRLELIARPRKERARRDKGAETDFKRRDRRESPWKILRVLRVLGVWIGSAISCCLRVRRDSGGRRNGFQNAELAEIAESLPGRFSAASAFSAFRSSPRSLAASACAETAEAAETDFKRRARRDRGESSWKILRVLRVLGVQIVSATTCGLGCLPASR